jgi:hypothetical protein
MPALREPAFVAWYSGGVHAFSLTNPARLDRFRSSRNGGALSETVPLLLLVQRGSEPGSGAHFRSHTKAEAGQQRVMREARRQRQRRPSREVMLSYSTKQ